MEIFNGAGHFILGFMCPLKKGGEWHSGASEGCLGFGFFRKLQLNVPRSVIKSSEFFIVVFYCIFY